MSAEAAAARWFDKAVLAPLGAGHIHDSYLMTVGSTRFVLQRINEVVFTDAELVMTQTQRLLGIWRRQQVYVAPVLQISKSGSTSERVAGDLWRVWQYIGDTVVVDPVATLDQARAAGAAFAALQSALNKLAEPLAETIPGFLQLETYLKQYDDVAAAAPAGLDRLVQDNRNLVQQLSTRNAHIHGDCKVNNLLFDESAQRVVAIIDFDTAMYGHWAWDFGDLVRSVCFSRGRADSEFFAACLRGFAEHQPLCNVADAVAAPSYIALMLGTRFLTDHLSGDRYFRVARAGENLLRAREQFALFESFTALQARLCEAAEDVLQAR